MSIRTRVTDGLKAAMKAREVDRLSTLRLINAAIKDRDIAARGSGGEDDAAGVDEGDLMALLAKMVKQRQESIRAYEEGGRLELAQKEAAEIAVIEEFLPRRMTEAEVAAAVEAAIADTGATGIRDMGRVIGALKDRYTGQMDFGSVGPMVKERLGCTS